MRKSLSIHVWWKKNLVTFVRFIDMYFIIWNMNFKVKKLEWQCLWVIRGPIYLNENLITVLLKWIHRCIPCLHPRYYVMLHFHSYIIAGWLHWHGSWPCIDSSSLLMEYLFIHRAHSVSVNRISRTKQHSYFQRYHTRVISIVVFLNSVAIARINLCAQFAIVRFWFWIHQLFHEGY